MRARRRGVPQGAGSTVISAVEFSGEWVLQGLLLFAVIAAVGGGVMALGAAGL
jgi:hypothetical protein